MRLAGPVGAVVAGSVAYSATAPASPLCRKGLMISRVTMPQEGLVRQQGVTYFRVDFLDMQGNTWHVLRRYNDFLDFHNRAARSCEKSQLDALRCTTARFRRGFQAREA